MKINCPDLVLRHVCFIPKTNNWSQMISVREKSAKNSAIAESLDVSSFVPEYVTFDAETLTGSLNRIPERSELAAEINEAFIVEFYSR